MLALAALATVCLSGTAAAAPPHVDARAVLVENGTTGQVLYRYRAADRVPIASITKLMTVLVTLQHARLSDVVVAPEQAADVGESSIDLQAGERLTVRELLEAALIQSANDAAWALAYHVGRGSVPRFVAMMNAEARRLGLHDTHYVRPDGLDAPGHVSSARDVTKLARILMRRPVVRAIVAKRTATIPRRTLHTWNDLLWTYPGVIGVKTGHTSLAGWSEVAAARGRGLTLYATLLGSPSRDQRDADLARLLTWGLGRFRYAPVISSGRAYATMTTGFGKGRVRLVASRPVYRAVRVGAPLMEETVAPRNADLPVDRGERLGEVRVFQDGRLVAHRALVADRSVARPSLLGRVGWYVGHAAHNVWSWVT